MEPESIDGQIMEVKPWKSDESVIVMEDPRQKPMTPQQRADLVAWWRRNMEHKADG